MVKGKHLIRSALASAVLLVTTAVASAAALPGSGWYTTATFQNVGSATGTVSLQVLPQEGAAGSASTASFTLDPGANKVFLPGGGGTNGTVDVSPALSGNFAGSMVVSSDQQVVAIGQIGNNALAGLGVAGGTASAMYNGTDATASTLSYPLVKNNNGFKTTYFSIQAGGNAVSFTATIIDNAGGTHTQTGNISAGRSVLLDPNTGFTPAMAGSNCGSDPNVSPCVGSLSVVATGGSIVGAVVETQTNVTPQKIAQATSLLTPADSSDTILCAAIKWQHANTHRSSGVTVANTGTSAVDVQLTLTVASPGPNFGQTFQGTVNIPAGASRTFIGSSNNIGGMPAGLLASGVLKTVPAGGSIVAIVNESNAINGVGPLKATTSQCFSPAKATGKVALPLVKEKLGNVASSGVTIQNAGTAATTVSVVYNCGALGNVTLSTGSLAPGVSKTFFNTSSTPDGGGSVPAGANCGVTATAANPTTDKIIGLVNESSDLFGLPLDTKSYEGFNLQ